MSNKRTIAVGPEGPRLTVARPVSDDVRRWLAAFAAILAMVFALVGAPAGVARAACGGEGGCSDPDVGGPWDAHLATPSGSSATVVIAGSSPTVGIPGGIPNTPVVAGASPVVGVSGGIPNAPVVAGASPDVGIPGGILNVPVVAGASPIVNLSTGMVAPVRMGCDFDSATAACLDRLSP